MNSPMQSSSNTATNPPDSSAASGTSFTSPQVAQAPRSLWRNSAYITLWAGQAISVLGTQISLFAFPLLMLAVTRSLAQAGFVGALRTLPYLVLSLPAGVLVDRWDRKHVMVVCDTVRALALGSIPLVLVFGQLSPAQLYIVALVEGSLAIFYSLAEAAALPSIVPVAQLSAATAQNQVVDSVALLLGPFLGGVLYSIGRLIPFVADAISYAASVVSLLFIRVPFQAERKAQPRQHLWREMREGVVWLASHRALRFLTLLSAGLNLACYGYTILVIALAQQMHASSFELGIIFAGGGIGSILGTLVTPWIQRRMGLHAALVGSTWAWAVLWLPFAFAWNPLTLGIATAIGFLPVPINTVLVFTYRLAETPDRLRGRVNSVSRLVLYSCSALSFALTGVLVQAIGPVPSVLLLFVPQLLLATVASRAKALHGIAMREHEAAG